MTHSFLCATCGRRFTAVRSDAETCSEVCRKRRTRARAKVRAERDREAIERATDALAALRAAASITPAD